MSPARANLLPPPNRIKSSDSAADLKDCSDESSESSAPRETSLRDDVVVRGSDEPYSEPDINLEIQAEINECITYADALRAEGIDVRVVVETVAQEEVETSTRDPIEVRVDRVIHHAVLDDIPEPAQEEGAIEGTYETLEALVQRFHDHTMEIPVHQVQVIESIQRDLGHMIVAMGQQSTVISKRISELERDNTRLRGTNLEPLVEGGGEQEDKNGDDYEGGNEGGNKNRGVNGNGGNENGGVNRNGNGRGNGNRNSNRNGGGNGYNFRAIGIEAAYAMKWIELIKLMTEVYCPRNKIQNMEAEMVPDEEDKVERFIGGLPDNIQGNVIAA
ncbi:hypothetical protein Tco_1009485 [Tanacetum coccineum]